MPWTLRPHHSVISLTPLDDAQVHRMVAELARQGSLSEEVIKGVSERAGGVPLFVEEVTRLLLERGEQGGAKAIPPTLQQSLAARLDRLGPAREVAQIGAVLGRTFSYAVLRNVASHAALVGPGQGGPGQAGDKEFDDSLLQIGLGPLLDADLLFVEGAPPQATYRFKHALIQDAAYDSLLKAAARCSTGARRRRSSRRTKNSRRLPATSPRAGLDNLAIEWWSKAGEDALSRSAYKEAVAHLGKAIAMAEKAQRATVQRGAEDRDLSSRLLKLHTDYGHAAMWLKGFAADEMGAAYARARELARPADGADARFVAYYAQTLTSFMRGRNRQARETVEAFLREAEAEGAPNRGGSGSSRSWFCLAQVRRPPSSASGPRAGFERLHP